jgi:hypothetical protein
MSAKLRKLLTLALLTVSFGLAGAQVPASAAAGAAPASVTPPTEPTSCKTSVLMLVTVDPCLIVGSLQEVAAYGLEDLATELGKNALQGVNLVNVCLRPSSKSAPPPPASLVNGCPVLGP